MNEKMLKQFKKNMEQTIKMSKRFEKMMPSKEYLERFQKMMPVISSKTLEQIEEANKAMMPYFEQIEEANKAMMPYFEQIEKTKKSIPKELFEKFNL